MRSAPLLLLTVFVSAFVRVDVCTEVTAARGPLAMGEGRGEEGEERKVLCQVSLLLHRIFRPSPVVDTAAAMINGPYEPPRGQEKLWPALPALRLGVSPASTPEGPDPTPSLSPVGLSAPSVPTDSPVFFPNAEEVGRAGASVCRPPRTRSLSAPCFI